MRLVRTRSPNQGNCVKRPAPQPCHDSWEYALGMAGKGLSGGYPHRGVLSGIYHQRGECLTVGCPDCFLFTVLNRPISLGHTNEQRWDGYSHNSADQSVNED
jgi:hypothetical protein